MAGGVVLFGGWNGAGNHNATWLFANNTWTNITPTHSPPAREGPIMSFDWIDQDVLLFGGCVTVRPGSACQYDNDSWTYRDGTWWNLTPRLYASPPLDGFAPLLYDWGEAFTLMYGRTYYTVNNYTYAYGSASSPTSRVAFFTNVTGCGSIDLAGTTYSNGENTSIGVGTYPLSATSTCPWAELTSLSVSGHDDYWALNGTVRIYGNSVVVADLLIV